MVKPKKCELDIVPLSAELTARVDSWAAAHKVDRAEAIQRLVQLGLKPKAEVAAPRRQRNDLAIEALAASSVGELIDPGTSPEERERRIHRLTEGPPEFVRLRIDLPGRGAP